MMIYYILCTILFYDEVNISVHHTNRDKKKGIIVLLFCHDYVMIQNVTLLLRNVYIYLML